MGVRDDLLTWQGVRALATVEAMNVSPTQLALVAMDPRRPPIKWYAQQRHWVEAAVPRAVQAGDVVYARAAWRAPWRAQLVSAVQSPAVLVTTFYDPTIKAAAVDEMFATPAITRWFGVQAATTHARLTPMPVGVEGSIVPILQAGERRAVRDIPLYLNFQLQHTGFPPHAGRVAAWQAFKDRPYVVAESWTRGGEAHYVAQLGRSQFVLSPPGCGWDCYRTYEALAMGAIPIVLRHPPQTDVCEALPVLLVDSWAEVTPERLATEWAARTEAPMPTLTMTYWRNQIHAAALAAKESLCLAR